MKKWKRVDRNYVNEGGITIVKGNNTIYTLYHTQSMKNIVISTERLKEAKEIAEDILTNFGDLHFTIEDERVLDLARFIANNSWKYRQMGMV